jgi:aspartate carbamoyltransferase catalytic subunit
MKHLLGIKDLSASEINLILDKGAVYAEFLKQKEKKLETLKGRSFINLFYENSTRTRTSFETASKIMGATSINISAQSSSVTKGETLIDTAKTLNALKADFIAIRHSMSGAARLLASQVSGSVINAGDGTNEHPTQALLDLLTMSRRIKSFKNIKAAIIGDVLHSRVARSNIYALNKLGAKVFAYGPKTLMPKGLEELNATVAKSMAHALEDADVIICLRIQLERQKNGFFPSLSEYSSQYGINSENIKKAKKGALVLHPGPINRGVEISSEVADGLNSVILEQVTNGLAVRMAVLELLSKD